MSYDICILTPEGYTRELTQKHHLTGGTNAIGGTPFASLNVTYNYSVHYHAIWGTGLRTFNRMKVSDAIPMLKQGVERLGSERDDDYWRATPGNAGAALLDLLTLCSLCEPGDIVEIAG